MHNRKDNPMGLYRFTFFAGLILLVCGYLLSGCASATLPDGSKAIVFNSTQGQDFSQFVTNLAQITHNDAMAATQMAANATPADVDGVTCYKGIDAFNATMAAKVPQQGQVTGLLTEHERLRLAAMNILDPNAGIAPLRTACAAMVMSDIEFRTRFQALVAAMSVVTGPK